MKQHPMVESVMSQVALPASRLEKFFNKTRLDNRGLDDNVSSDFHNIAYRSINVVAKGSIQVVFASGKRRSTMSVDIPTSAHFLVTGVRTYGQRYKLTFAVSLS